MTKTRYLTSLALGLALVSSSAAQAGRVYFQDVVHQNQTEVNQKHDRKGVSVIVVPEATVGTVEICFGYVNNIVKDRGNIRVTVEIVRADGVEMINLGGPVRKNAFGQCKDTDPLEAGDMLTFSIRFKGLPRVKPGNTFNWAGAVAVDGGDPFIRTACPAA